MEGQKKRLNKSDRKLIYELHERLVQTCLDFINEKGLGDVEEISFRADSLQPSADCGSWQPCTDSSCEFFRWTEKGGRELIDYSA